MYDLLTLTAEESTEAAQSEMLISMGKSSTVICVKYVRGRVVGSWLHGEKKK